MKHMIMLVLATIVVGGFAYANAQDRQQAPTEAQEKMKTLAPLIGEWANEFTAEIDSPLMKKGDKGISSWTWEWLPQNHGIVCRHVIKDGDGKRIVEMGRGLIGWDSVDGQFIENRISGNGSMSTRVYEKSDNGFVVHVKLRAANQRNLISFDLEIAINGDKLKRRRINKINAQGQKLPDDDIRREYLKQK